jgi:hypothetical protein
LLNDSLKASMEKICMAPLIGSDAAKSRIGGRISDDVVEIGLLLPAHRAEALIALSRQRHQSVGQILRGLIDQAISASDN